MTLRSWMLVSSVGINLYLLGVMLMFYRVVYPLFGSVPHDAFPNYYSAFNSRIALPVVVPEFVAFLVVVPLVWWRPIEVPGWSVYTAIALGIAYFGITFGTHLPVHSLLAKGDSSPAVIAPLLSTQALRTWVQAAKCALLLWMSAVSTHAGS